MPVKIILAICTALFFAENIMAEDENSSMPKVEFVDGATNPDEIPDHVKYNMFVKRYSIDVRDHLVQKLSAADDSILFTLAAEDESAEEAEGQAYTRAMTDLCARMHVLSADQVAEEHNELLRQFRDNRLQRFTVKLDALSAGGRQLVESYIADYIVPNTRTQKEIDERQIAAIEPEQYLARFALKCRTMQTGSLPPELREKVDDKARQVKQELQERLSTELDRQKDSSD